MDELLCYDSKDGHQSIDINNDIVAGSQSNSSPYAATAFLRHHIVLILTLTWTICLLTLNMNQMMMKLK